jgi:hypothetical protein
VPDTRPAQPNCTTDSNCQSDQKCEGGFCRYKCTTDAQCRQIDARIGYCSTSDGVCRTQSEAHPQCTQKSDCPAGQDCIGNVCQ